MQKLHIRKWTCGSLAVSCMLIYMSFAFVNPESASPAATETVVTAEEDTKAVLYDNLELGSLGLSRQAFDYA